MPTVTAEPTLNNFDAETKRARALAVALTDACLAYREETPAITCGPLGLHFRFDAGEEGSVTLLCAVHGGGIQYLGAVDAGGLAECAAIFQAISERLHAEALRMGT